MHSPQLRIWTDRMLRIEEKYRDLEVLVSASEDRQFGWHEIAGFMMSRLGVGDTVNIDVTGNYDESTLKEVADYMGAVFELKPEPPLGKFLCK